MGWSEADGDALFRQPPDEQVGDDGSSVFDGSPEAMRRLRFPFEANPADVTEQGQDVMVLVRHEAGAFSQTARRLRRKTVKAVDRIELKLEELETLYDVVHDEFEGAALDAAAALRSVRRGNGMLGRVRRFLVPSR